jgi:PAS domain S-box-containing protein
MLGFSEEEMRSKHCVEFSPPEDAEKDWALFEQLRAGLIDRYQIEKRFIRRDGSLIWGRLSVSLLNRTCPLVVAMVEDITPKRTAEEARLRQAAIVESSEDAIISKNLDAVIESWNASSQRIFGYTESEAVGQPITSLIPRELWDEEHQILERLRAGERIEHYETIRITKAGRKVDVSLTISPIKDPSGRIVGFSKIARDITKRKLAEAALSTLTHKLIDAQEQERTRIGRELHDDIGQRLALVAVELQQLHEDTLILPEIRSRMGEFEKQISEIAADIQSLSHELHSAKLQYLGIAGAIKSFCQEFAEHQRVEIDFKTHDLPSPLSPDISLCLFRVLQEALHNSAKHSGVRQFEVRLWGTSDEIHLTVKDSGAGFDREAAKESRGIGLISMEERLKLVNGTLSIDSQPKRGTTIHARVSFDSSSDSAWAAG